VELELPGAARFSRREWQQLATRRLQRTMQGLLFATLRPKFATSGGDFATQIR
jgi:hypothetical protein